MNSASLLAIIAAAVVCGVFICQVYDDAALQRINMLDNPTAGADLTEAFLAAEFDYFVSKYARSYVSSDEHQARFRVFADNYRKIVEHNERSSELGYTLMINKFGDLTREEFRNQYLGVGRDKDFTLNSNLAQQDFSPVDSDSDSALPSYVDWREKDKVSRVKDQGKCKGGWAFSAIATIESANRIAGKSNDDLSEQQLID